MSNSPLVCFTKISPNKSCPRNHEIDTITIHCVVGQCTAEGLGDWFSNPKCKGSSNYGVDKDGRIGMYVEEKDRSWCSSSSSNDNRAITIEVASDKTEPYAVNNKAYESLIILVADICKRNNIKELKWKADKSLIGNVDKQNMTVHKWFADTACPGQYLYNRYGDIANRVNNILKSYDKNNSNTDNNILYKVQVGAYKYRNNAENMLNKLKNAGFEGFITTVKEEYNTEINSNTKPKLKSNEEIAKEVINGNWGNGVERKNRLTEAGYNYRTIQALVDKILS